MTSPTWSRRIAPLGLLASALLAGPTLPAQGAGQPATAPVGRGPLDTAAILASARRVGEVTAFSFEPPSLTDLFLDAVSEGRGA